MIKAKIKGNGDEEGDVSSYWMILWKWIELDIEIGSARWHSVQNWLWKRLWACRKADYGMDAWMNERMNEWFLHKDNQNYIPYISLKTETSNRVGFVKNIFKYLSAVNTFCWSYIPVGAIFMQFRIVLLVDRRNRGFDFHSAYGCITVFFHTYALCRYRFTVSLSALQEY